jgi:hypothetical protein
MQLLSLLPVGELNFAQKIFTALAKVVDGR